MKKYLFISIIFTLLISFTGCENNTKEESKTENEKLAICLTEKGYTMYGSQMCGHCKKQKELFAEGFKHINYIECYDDGEYNQKCIDDGIKAFPSWKRSDGEILRGRRDLSELSAISGCSYNPDTEKKEDTVVSENAEGKDNKDNKDNKVIKEDKIITKNEENKVIKEDKSNKEETKDNEIKNVNKENDIKKSDNEETEENLEKLAKCLTEKGAKMYGAVWCGHCRKQKEAFGDAFKDVKYIECDKKTGTPEICKEAGITGYPTWITGEGKQIKGRQKLENLAEEVGCPFS